MRTYCHLFRLRLAIQWSHAINYLSKIALLIALVFAFFFSQAAFLCYWIVCFLVAMSSLTTADHYLLVQLPITRKQAVRAHYLYCLLLNGTSFGAFWLLSSIDPLPALSANVAFDTSLSLILLFIVSLPFYAILLCLYYHGHKYTGLFSIVYYIVTLLGLNELPTLSLTARPLLALLIVALIVYALFCRFTCRYFARKDLL